MTDSFRYSRPLRPVKRPGRHGKASDSGLRAPVHSCRPDAIDVPPILAGAPGLPGIVAWGRGEAAMTGEGGSFRTSEPHSGEP